MPALFQLTPRALDDIGNIWDFIAQDHVEAADRVESAILSACEILARNPLLGSKRSEITDFPVRFWTLSRYPNFVVVYRPDRMPLQIVAILHGKRNIRAILEQSPEN